MSRNEFLFTFLTIVAVAWIAAASAQPTLFHGTSVLTLPSNDTSLFNDATYVAKFFSYVVEEGYFSFGWWVNAKNSSGTSYYQLDLDSFHWLQLAERKSCDGKTGACIYRTRHVPVHQADDVETAPIPETPLEYLIYPSGSGNEGFSWTMLSSADDNRAQMHGVGRRRNLRSKAHTAEECHNALRTLKRLYETHDVDLGFEIRDLCEHENAEDNGFDTYTSEL